MIHKYTFFEPKNRSLCKLPASMHATAASGKIMAEASSLYLIYYTEERPKQISAETLQVVTITRTHALLKCILHAIFFADKA
jgi:hypothetical protein